MQQRQIRVCKVTNSLATLFFQAWIALPVVSLKPAAGRYARKQQCLVTLSGSQRISLVDGAWQSSVPAEKSRLEHFFHPFTGLWEDKIFLSQTCLGSLIDVQRTFTVLMLTMLLL